MTDRQAKKHTMDRLIRYYGKVWFSGRIINLYRVVENKVSVFSFQAWCWRNTCGISAEKLALHVTNPRTNIRRFTAGQVRAMQRIQAINIKNKAELFLETHPHIDD